MSNSLWPSRLHCPWSFPGLNSGVDCHFLLQRIFLTQGSKLCLLHHLHWQVDSFPLRHLGGPYGFWVSRNMIRFLFQKDEPSNCVYHELAQEESWDLETMMRSSLIMKQDFKNVSTVYRKKSMDPKSSVEVENIRIGNRLDVGSERGGDVEDGSKISRLENLWLLGNAIEEKDN